MMKHEYFLQVLEHHLDTFGHVNHTTYLALLEEARWDWMQSGGYGMKVIHELRKAPVVTEVQIRYLSEIRLREKIRIESTVIQDRAITRIPQKLWVGEKLAAEATVVCVFIDLDTRKMIRPPAEWLRLIKTS